MTADVIILRPITAPRAIDVACAAIAQAFDDSAEKDFFKRRVRSFIRLGTGHPAVRARYGRRVAMLKGYSLDAAIYITERQYRDERKAWQIACIWGGGSIRLSVEVLRELRLMLRLLRRSQEREHLAGILAFVLGREHPQTIDVESEATA